MRLTIIKADNAVYVDGHAILGIDCSDLPEGFHALQWYEDHGEIEWVDPKKSHHHPVGNEPITDITPYQKYIDAHAAAKAEAEKPKPPGQGTMNVIA